MSNLGNSFKLKMLLARWKSEKILWNELARVAKEETTRIVASSCDEICGQHCNDLEHVIQELEVDEIGVK